MFTKSNLPGRVHWCRTRAPSSSMSRLTSRSRLGFDWSVRRPWSVRVDSIRYVGIAAPFRSEAGLYSRASGLVLVQQRGAEEEERRDDEVREEERDAGGLVAAV